MYLGVLVTWVDLEVRGDSVRVNNDLKHVREFVGLVVSRRRLFRLHSVQYRRHAASTALLSRQYGHRSSAQRRITYVNA